MLGGTQARQMIKCYNEELYAFWSGIIGIAIFAVPFLFIVFLAALCGIADKFIRLFNKFRTRKEK